jgi:hypothetical protein
MKKYIALLLCCFSCASFSLTLESVQVFGEEVSECNISQNAANASISSAMRFNRIALSDESRIRAYHQITAMGISGGCAATINFQIYFNSFVPVPPKNTNRVFTKNLLCSKVFLLSGPRYDFGTRVNDSLKEAVDLCINEISKM